MTLNTRANVSIMGTLLTHWGNLIPSEVILGVAKESHDATHEVNAMDLGARCPL